MKRLLIVPVVLLALLAGAAIAGRPTTVNHDIRFVEIPPTTTSTTTLPPVTTTSTTTTTTTTAPPPESTAVAAEPDTAGGSVADADAASAFGAAQPPSSAPATSSTSTLPSVRPMTSVFLVVANAANTYGLAAATATMLEAVGYEGIIRTDGTINSDATAVYYKVGFEAEAKRLAEQLGFDGEVGPLPAERRFKGTANPEVLLWLGRDWADVTNIDYDPG